MTAVPQSRRKQPNDEAREEKSDDDCVAYAGDRFLHNVGLVVEDAHFDAGRKGGAYILNFLMDQIRGPLLCLLSGWRLMLSKTAGFPFAVTTVKFRRGGRSDRGRYPGLERATSFTFLMTMSPISSGRVNLRVDEPPGKAGDCG